MISSDDNFHKANTTPMVTETTLRIIKDNLYKNKNILANVIVNKYNNFLSQSKTTAC